MAHICNNEFVCVCEVFIYKIFPICIWSKRCTLVWLQYSHSRIMFFLSLTPLESTMSLSDFNWTELNWGSQHSICTKFAPNRHMSIGTPLAYRSIVGTGAIMRGWVDPNHPLWRLDPHRPRAERPTPRVESLRNEDSSFLSAPPHLLPLFLWQIALPHKPLTHCISSFKFATFDLILSLCWRIHSPGRGRRFHFHTRPAPPFFLFFQGAPVSDQLHFFFRVFEGAPVSDQLHFFFPCFRSSSGVQAAAVLCDLPLSSTLVQTSSGMQPETGSHYFVVLYNFFQASLAQNPQSMHW